MNSWQPRGESCCHTTPGACLPQSQDAPTTREHMTEQQVVDWPTCSQEGCAGVHVFRATSTCLAHASPDVQERALKRLSTTGKIDVRGVSINEALLAQI